MNVCKIIIQIIKIFILKTAISVKITSRFDDKCKNARIRINQIKKTLQQFLTENANEEIIEEAQKIWKRVKSNKKRTIKRVRRRNHRKAVEKAAENAQKTWKLIKWAKNKKILFKFFTFSLHRSNNTTVLTKTNKTHCLKEIFFHHSHKSILIISQKQHISKNSNFFISQTKKFIKQYLTHHRTKHREKTKFSIAFSRQLFHISLSNWIKSSIWISHWNTFSSISKKA